MSNPKDFTSYTSDPKNQTTSTSDNSITTNPNFRITPQVYNEISKIKRKPNNPRKYQKISSPRILHSNNPANKSNLHIASTFSFAFKKILQKRQKFNKRRINEDS